MDILQNLDKITFGIIVLIIVGILFFFLPSYIAFRRKHKYKWIIFAINLIVGGSGIGWLIAFIWAVWPQRSSLIDPIIDPSGKGGMSEEFGERVSEFHEYASTKNRSLFCENCGNKISDKAKFCGNCGNKIITASQNSNQASTNTEPYSKSIIDSHIRRTKRTVNYIILAVFLVIVMFLSFKSNPNAEVHKEYILYGCWGAKDQEGHLIRENVSISGRYANLITQLENEESLKSAYKDYLVFSLVRIDGRTLSLGLWDGIRVTSSAKEYYGNGFKIDN